MQEGKNNPMAAKPGSHRVRRTVAALLLMIIAGCGADQANPSVPDGGSAPHPTASPADILEAASPAPTTDSAATFGTEVLARLNQESFYAGDTSFIDAFVHPDAYHEVVGELNLRVEDTRWAIATFPGATKRAWFVASPLTVNVTAFDATTSTASVEVWVVTVFSREDLGSVDSRFYTEHADLIWTDDRWLIASLAATSGPSASLAIDEAATTPADLDTLLEGHDLITSPTPNTPEN